MPHMLPPVRITQTELVRAIGRIARRHQDTGCCEPDEIPSPARLNSRDTLAFLRRHPVQQTPGWIARADSLDAQLLVIASTWDHWRTEYFHLRGGLSDGLFHDQFGAALGLGPEGQPRDESDPRPARRGRTGSGNPQQPSRVRMAALADLLRHDDPTPKLDRTSRRSQPVDPEDARWTWLADHRDALASVALGLAAVADRHRLLDHRWRDELVADVTDDALTPATLAVLGLTIAEIRTARPIAELTTTHNVHRLLLEGDALRCQFSGVDCHAHWQSAPPHSDVAALVREIAQRRERMDDHRWGQLPSPEAAEPAEVLQFLRRCPATNRAVRARDHLAGLRLGNELWWRDRNDERTALQFGLRIGNPKDVLRRQIGASYAITSGQGVRDRADRLASLTTHARPDEKLARDLRNPQPSQLSQEDSWILTNHEMLRRVATSLLDAATSLGIPDDERDWLDLLASECRVGSLTSSSLVTFAYAADEIQDALEGVEHETLQAIQLLLNEVDGFPGVHRLRAATRPLELEL